MTLPRCSHHRIAQLCLDNAFVLIDGHPRAFGAFKPVPPVRHEHRLAFKGWLPAVNAFGYTDQGWNRGARNLRRKASGSPAQIAGRT